VAVRRCVWTIRLGGLSGRVRPLGEAVRGANVEGVALGFKAFGVETADGAALGLLALGLTDEAAALGFDAFGPVAAGAEPGVGMKTPWAVASPVKMKAAQTIGIMNKRSQIHDMPPSSGTNPLEPT